MSAKSWSNERWECPTCGVWVAAKEQHGIEDCVTNLKRQVRILDKVGDKMSAQQREMEDVIKTQKATIDSLNIQLYFTQQRNIKMAGELSDLRGEKE